MPSYLDGAAVATLTVDTVPVSISVTPTTATSSPSGTRQLTAVILTSGGRNTGLAPTSWTVADTTNFSISSTGLLTFPATAGLSTTATAHYGAITSNSVSVVCSSFSGMSAAAAAQLESIRVGLSNELTMVNQFIPGVTTMTTNPFLQGIGWTVYGVPGYGTIVNDPTATYGAVLRQTNPAGVRIPIANLVRGNPTVITLASSSAPFTTNPHWSGNGATNFQIRNYTGNNTAGQIPNLPPNQVGTLDVDGVTVTITTDSSASGPIGLWATPPASGTYTLGFAGGVGFFKMLATPEQQGCSALGDIAYKYTKVRLAADYKGNDGAGSQKGFEGTLAGTPGSYQGEYNPAFYGTNTNEDGDVSASISIIQVNKLNGVDVVPTNNKQFNFIDAEVRGVSHTYETIQWFPAARDAESDEYIFRNGVLIQHNTVRQSDTGTGNLNLAWRGQGVGTNNTFGGGGDFPLVDNIIDYEEIYYAIGVGRAGMGPDHFVGTCEEGDTPPNAPFHINFALKDGNGTTMDVTSNWLWFLEAGRTIRQIEATATHGTVTAVDANGLGTTRVTVTPTGTGSCTVTVTLYQIANNDKRIPGVTYVGSKTVTVT